MKRLICEICIWILRQFDVSVIINFKCTGTIKGRSKDIVYYYNNDFEDVKVFDLYDRDITDRIPNIEPFNFQT